MLPAAPLRVRELRLPQEPNPRLPASFQRHVPHPSLFVQTGQAQYRGTLQATAVATAGALHTAGRERAASHFIIKKPSPLSKCFTLVHHTMPNGQTLVLKDTSEKHTSVSRPADHTAKRSDIKPISESAEDGSDFDASAFDRSEKSIEYIVQRILPNIPHLVSVPTKTPYVREFPNENLNTPFDDWEVRNLQHMTLVSNGSRGVAWARGDWQEEYNAPSPRSGFRSGTATPRSEKDANRIRTKMSLADYKANANKRPMSTPQPAPIGNSQIVLNGKSSTSKNSESPTQQMIDQIVENNISKLVPKFSNDHPVDIARPPRPDPPYISDAPHPGPMPKPQRQPEEGRAVWPPSNKPDWKQTQTQEGPSEQRAKMKRSDYASMPSHPQHPSNQQKRLDLEQKRQISEEKQAARNGALKQQPQPSAKGTTSKISRPPKSALANPGKGDAVAQQSSDSQSVTEQKPTAPVRISTPTQQSNISIKGPQKERFGNEKPLSIDLNVSDPVNGMPPLLSPLPAGLLSPDHPGLDGNTISHGSKPNQITPPSSTKSKTTNPGPTEQSQSELVSPLESPFEMPPLLSPLPEWWMERVRVGEEKARLHDLDSQATTIATLGARRERSRQPDTPGVARKTTKSKKTKSSLARDHTTADPTDSISIKAEERADKPNKKADSNGAERETLIVKVKYGKRNSKRIFWLLQMTARPLAVAETKSLPTSAHTPAGTESRKHARLGDDVDEPSAKRGKAGKNDAPFSASPGRDVKKHSRQVEDSEEPSTKRPKVSNKDIGAPTSLGPEARKRARPADEVEQLSTKRPKVTSSVDVQRARTPVTPSAQSPAPSTSQKTFNTPKKGDAMKSVVMRRVDSNDGQVLTPHGGSVSTPASNEKPRNSGVETKHTEIDALKVAHAKYTTIGTTLKRQADQILKIKEKVPGPVSDEEKRLGAVIAIESVVAYMIGFDSMDKSRHKERKAGYAEQWSQFLPFMDFATERAKGQEKLFTLALLLNAVSRECLERIFMERIIAEPAGSVPSYLKELAKNSQQRQSALSAYRDQCKDHPVEFTVSIDEAKGIAVGVLADYCEKMDIAWETKLEL